MATQHSGSRKACSVKGVVKVRVTLWAAFARAVLASPRVTWRLWQTLSLSWTVFPKAKKLSWMRGAPSARASSMLRTGSSSSQVTLTAFLAFSKISGVSATTRQTASPMQRVTSPSAIMTSQSWMRWPTWLWGTSAAVSTPMTPSMAQALDESILTTRARAYLERTAEA